MNIEKVATGYRLTGCPGEPHTVRVKVVERRSVPNGSVMDLVVKVAAVPVNDDGFETGTAGPLVGRTLHGDAILAGMSLSESDFDSLRTQACEQYVNDLAAKSMAAGIPDQL